MSEFDQTFEYVHQKLLPIRDIVIHLHSILIWKKSYHAPCIIMLITFIFMCLWLINISILSKLCFIGIIITLLDYFLPILNNLVSSFNNKTEWTNEMEQLFNNQCTKITNFFINLKKFINLLSTIKYTNTKLYYTTILTLLMILASIGQYINNLLLLYLLIMFIILYPGLSYYNMFDDFFNYIKNLLLRIPLFQQQQQLSQTNQSKHHSKPNQHKQPKKLN